MTTEEKIPVNDWWVLRSKSGKHPECGYPLGETLCRHWEDIPEIIKNSGMNDPIIEKYDTYTKEGCMLTEEEYKKGTLIALHNTATIIEKNPTALCQMRNGTPFVAEVKFPHATLIVSVNSQEVDCANASQPDGKKIQQVFCDEVQEAQHP